MAKIPALKVHQWLSEWDDFDYSDKHSTKPEKHFYIFSMKASQLRALSGVNRRRALANKGKDLGIQRRHEESRSIAIREYIHNGYPYSDLPKARKNSPSSNNLKKPGWLPTSIIVNVLGPNAERDGKKVDPSHLIKIHASSSDGFAQFEFPNITNDIDCPPLEVIDGQHRLWAFESNEELDYELPVVAFYDLDIAWQAYLFWAINVKPKKINASLAYDLYPLLRRQSWLTDVGDIPVYREARAQEIVNSLWSLHISPWNNHINMLGEGGRTNGISQSSWVGSLTASLLRKQGAFENGSLDDWGASTQVALLIFLGKTLSNSLSNSADLDWYQKLTKHLNKQGSLDIGANKVDSVLLSHYSLLGTDQGIRPLLVLYDKLLQSFGAKSAWKPEDSSDASDLKVVSLTLEELEGNELGQTIKMFSNAISSFDWRTASVTDKDRESELYNLKMGFKGASGYTHLRQALINHLNKSDSQEIKNLAKVLK